MDRGLDPNLFHTCLVIKKNKKISWRGGECFDYDGKILKDVLMLRDVMKDLTISEVIISLRGNDNALLTKDDLIDAFQPPTLASFLKSEWGKQLNFWSASLLGITQEDIKHLSRSEVLEIESNDHDWWLTTFGFDPILMYTNGDDATILPFYSVQASRPGFPNNNSPPRLQQCKELHL